MMKCDLSDAIRELIGQDSPEVIVISDGELDVNKSTVDAFDIQTASFDKYRSVEKAQKETIKNALEAKKGVHIKVDKSIDAPLHVVLEHGENAGQYVFIEVGDNVHATIVEHHIACDCGADLEDIIVPNKIEVAINNNSKIMYSGFDTSGIELKIERCFTIGRDSVVDIAIGMFGNSVTSENYTALLAEGAEVESKLMMFAKDKQKQLHKIKMSHFSPHTKSNIINHGVVSDEAIGKFEGIGFIEKGSHQADAQQESRIMVLDERARADVHPILLIDEYDVMAGHAGSVGRVSDESLYYLQSRGLSRKEAMLLVTEGFLRPVVENINDEATKTRIEEVIREKVGLNRGLA